MKSRTSERRQQTAGWALLAPALALIGVFFFVPVLAGLVMSFTDFDIYSIGRPDTIRFMGFENYRQVLADTEFWRALRNTLYFVVVGGPLSVAASLAAALLVNAKLARMKGFFRTVFFTPVVTTMVAVAIVFRYLLHPHYGLVNQALAWFHVAPIDWLGDPHWSMPAIVLLAVWKNFGYNMLIFIAGLQSIPDDLYEAAQLDGAGARAQFVHVTLPSLGPTFLFVGIMTMIGQFQIFAEPYVMTQGGPLRSTVSVVMLMYEQGFRWWRMGYATAIAFILFVIMMAVTMIQMWLQGERGAVVKRALPSILVHALLVVGALITLTPLLWMVSASFMPTGQASSFPPPLLPSAPTLEHYRDLFTRLNLARNFANSLVITVGVTLFSLLVNSMAGYAFAKLRFTGRDATFKVLVAAMVIPGQVGMMPLFLIVKSMGLVNTPWGVMITGLATVFGIFMIRQFALSIPDDLLDAARIDGASEWRIYWTIVLPVLKPILVTMATFSFLSSWNDFMWPLIVLSDSSQYTLPVALANLVGEHVQDTELMMAGSVLTILPVLAVFLVMQRSYIKGVLMGSVKG